MSAETPTAPAQGGLDSISDIKAATTSEFRKRLGRAYLSIVVAGVLWDVSMFVILLRSGVTEPRAYLGTLLLPWVILAGWRRRLAEKIRGRFWRQFALHHGWTYQPRGDLRGERAVMFHEGHSRSMRHVVSGALDSERPFRIFEYKFSAGHGRRRHDYFFTTFAVRFSGAFPHLYLDRLKNGYGTKAGVSLPLPGEFTASFRLFCPAEYEIEALQVFSPEILAYLLDANFPHDIELLDQELHVFTRGYINTLQDLEERFQMGRAIVERLAPRLDRLRLTPIGTHKTTLT